MFYTCKYPKLHKQVYMDYRPSIAYADIKSIFSSHGRPSDWMTLKCHKILHPCPFYHSKIYYWINVFTFNDLHWRRIQYHPFLFNSIILHLKIENWTISRPDNMSVNCHLLSILEALLRWTSTQLRIWLPGEAKRSIGWRLSSVV